MPIHWNVWYSAKYFECLKCDIYSEVKIGMDETSFLSVLFISGEGTIETDDGNKTMPYKAGESFFISAGKRSVVIKGTGTCTLRCFKMKTIKAKAHRC